jgi:hypothetical protein
MNGSFFNVIERLHYCIPAALGFVCGLLRRVGGGAVLNKAEGNPEAEPNICDKDN